LLERRDEGFLAFFGGGIELTDVVLDGVHLGVGLVDGDAWLEACDGDDVVDGTVVALGGVALGDGSVDVRLAVLKTKVGREDSDDRVADSAQSERLAECGGIAGEAVLATNDR